LVLVTFGTTVAVCTAVVIALRTRLWAAAILASMLVTSVGLVCAHAAGPSACRMHPPACHETAGLHGDCCSLEANVCPDAPQPATAAPSAIGALADAPAVLLSTPLSPPVPLGHLRAGTFASRVVPPDLITLFRTLLL
jgi:hypothetical protein